MRLPPGFALVPVAAPARSRISFLRAIVVGSVLVLGVWAWTAPAPALTLAATYSGSDCATAGFECWLIHDWDVSAFGSVEARYTITLNPGARVYCRWETTARYQFATAFYNAGTVATSNNMSAANSTYVRLIVSTADRAAAYHCWTDASTTGTFAITNARFITTPPDFAGTATGQPTLGPGVTGSANPFYTYCPAPTPTGYIGPPMPSVCTLPTPTPAAPGTCDSGYGSGSDVITSWSGPNGFSVCSLQETAGKEYRLVVKAVTVTAEDVAAYCNNNRIINIGLNHGSGTGFWTAWFPASNGGGTLNDGAWRFGRGDGGADTAFTSGCPGQTVTWTGNLATSWGAVDNGSHFLQAQFLIAFSCNGNTPACSGAVTYRIEVRDVGASTANPASTASPGPTVPPYVAPSEPPPPPDNGGFAFPTRIDVNMCPRPRPSPEIAACAPYTTSSPPPPLASPPPGAGGNGQPNGSGVPNGVAECAAASHPPKPGTMPYETMAVPPEPAGPWDVGAYGAWIGTHVSNIPRVGSNAVKGALNGAIDLVVPGECVGVIVQTFGDEVNGRVPFAWFTEVRDGLSAGSGGAVAIGTVNLGPTSVDLGDAMGGAASATAPYRTILGLLPWLLGALAIMRKVMGTVGAGEGGG